MYLGDFRAGDVIDDYFSTELNGVMTTLAGTPAIRVYKGNGTIESGATGITLDVDFDARTGLNHYRIDTGADAFYADANDYAVVITTGTVGGQSVVGRTVATFSLKHRSALRPVISGRELAVDANGYTTVVTNNDKTGYALSAAGIQAVWDALTAALTTVGSIGKLLVDRIDAAISSRLATASYSAPLDAAGTRAAVGLAAANLDAQLTAIDDYIDTEVAAILAAVDTEVAAIKAKTDNLPEGIAKNAALGSFCFLMIDSADHVSHKTGLVVTAARSIDGAAFAACANAVTEVGNGVYKINLAGSDLNGTLIVLRFTAVGADPTVIILKTEV